MILISKKYHLQVEVILEAIKLAQAHSEMTITEICDNAMNEWDM